MKNNWSEVDTPFGEKVLNALLDRQDRDAPEEKFELVY